MTWKIKRRPAVIAAMCFSLVAMPVQGYVSAAESKQAAEEQIAYTNTALSENTTQTAASIELVLKSAGIAWEGVELSFYRVTDGITNADGTGGVLTDAFSDFELPIDVTDDENPSRSDPDKIAQLKKRLAIHVAANSISPDYTCLTDAEGAALVSGLPLGLYFVMASGYEKYGTMDYCLIWTPAAGTDGEYVYDIVAEAKVEPTTPEESTSETTSEESTEETTPEETTTASAETTPEETTTQETTTPGETTAPETTIPEESTAPTTTQPEETTQQTTTETTPQTTTVPETTTSAPKILGIIDMSELTGKMMITGGIVLLAAVLVAVAIRAFRNQR